MSFDCSLERGETLKLQIRVGDLHEAFSDLIIDLDFRPDARHISRTQKRRRAENKTSTNSVSLVLNLLGVVSLFGMQALRL